MELCKVIIGSTILTLGKDKDGIRKAKERIRQGKDGIRKSGPPNSHPREGYNFLGDNNSRLR